MNDRARLDLRFDPKRLQEDLLRLSGIDWIDHFVKQNYQGEWSVIPLRGPAGAEHPVMMIYSDPHRVANRGQTDRVHMVIDAAVNRLLQDHLSQVGLE